MDELDLIARFPGGGDAPDIPAEVRARTRARVMLTISAPGADRRHSGRDARTSPASRTLGLGIAAAIGAVIVALIVPVAFTDDARSSAWAALLELAETASASEGGNRLQMRSSSTSAP